MKTRIALILCAFLLTIQYAYATPSKTTLCNLAPQEQTVQQFLERMEQKANTSTYRLYYLKDTCVGSAWVLKTNGFQGTVLITATHCVIDNITKKPKSDFWWIGHPSWDPEKKLQFKLLIYDEAKDVAILSSPEHYGLEELTIANATPNFPDPLFVMAISPNSISQFLIGNYVCRVTLPRTNQSWDLITNYTRPGCSGAPVLNIAGEVVGIIHGVLIFQSNSFSIRNMVSRDTIVEVVASAGIVPFIDTSSK
ncbi:MAG: trypsin-like peptidase domain-containing protein [Parcubacteria group bacterium]|nr:trypsin-like peptidase domain-containing protein [Parcubacteria group bacterium]